YGLKQAPRAWFTKLKTFLISSGFRSCYSDTSLFVYAVGDTLAYLLVYVDDLILTGNTPAFLSAFTAQLHHKFSLKDLGPLHYFLGIEVHRTPTSLFLTQSKYVRDILHRAKMTDAKPISSPAEPGSRLLDDGDP